MAHKNKMKKYPVDTTSQNESAYCVGLNPSWKKTRFQLALNKTFYPNMYSILTVNELGPPVLESSARISKFYAPTDSEHKFNKTEMENWLPIGYNLGSS